MGSFAIANGGIGFLLFKNLYETLSFHYSESFQFFVEMTNIIKVTF